MEISIGVDGPMGVARSPYIGGAHSRPCSLASFCPVRRCIPCHLGAHELLDHLGRHPFRFEEGHLLLTRRLADGRVFEKALGLAR